MTLALPNKRLDPTLRMIKGMKSFIFTPPAQARFVRPTRSAERHLTCGQRGALMCWLSSPR